jgi:oligopeptide transport system substrate-binding protein
MESRLILAFLLVVLLLAALAWTAGALGGPAIIGPAESQSYWNPPTVNVYLGADDVPTLDPALAADSASQNVIEQLFIGLVDLDDDTSEPLPELASSWDISQDRMVYTFTLRSDARWSDGRPITAGDVRYGILRALDPGLNADYAYVLAELIENAEGYNDGTITDPNLVGVKELDDTHLEVTLASPASYALSILSMPVGRPVPKWAIDA